MRLVTTGRAIRITRPIVGRVTTTPLADRTNAVLLASVANCSPGDLAGYAAIMTKDDADKQTTVLNAVSAPAMHSIRDVDHIRDRDVVALSPTGHVRTVYRPDSDHNTLFITERCNSNCLMCSQPPKDHDDTEHFLAINRAVVDLMDLDTKALGITGGEPTLLREGLCELLSLLRDRLPATHLHLLTNGRLFAWPEFASRFAQIRHPDLVLGIPLYSDTAVGHDYVVQAKNAFDQTVMGLHQLARWGVQVEIRVVLHRLTISRLVHLAEYIYRNFPFVVHIALMGLEPTGYTIHHREKLWIDPFDYQASLEETVEFLNVRGLNVSIYNLQRCVLPRSLWPFARQSISDWKNIYFDECALCVERANCAGFFQSAERLHSSHIQALE